MVTSGSLNPSSILDGGDYSLDRIGQLRMMRHAWGKTDRESESGTTHPLAHHSLDVAAVFLRMLDLPVIRNRLEAASGTQLTGVDCQRLAVLAFLHDIGKLHPGFQAKGWPEELRRGPVRGHSKESWAFLTLANKWAAHPFHDTMRKIMRWGPAVPPLVAAMFGHHGRPVEAPPNPTLRDWDTPHLPHYDWRGEAGVMNKVVCRSVRDKRAVAPGKSRVSSRGRRIRRLGGLDRLGHAVLPFQGTFLLRLRHHRPQCGGTLVGQDWLGCRHARRF